MAMRTKPGVTSVVKALYAPVMEPGLIRYFFSYSYTLRAEPKGESVKNKIISQLLLTTQTRRCLQTNATELNTKIQGNRKKRQFAFSQNLILVRVPGDENINVELALEVGE
jgi:hypothetical protein